MRDGRKTVLFFQEAWGRGGIETFVMNAIRSLGTEKYCFEIWSAYDWYNGFDDELASLGILRVSAFPGEKPGLIRRFRTSARLWRERLSRGDVDVVHVNAMNGSTLAYTDIARRFGVPVRISHSHNSDFGNGARLLKSVIHWIGRTVWGDAATNRLACSKAAGIYLFGKSEFSFLPNGIDVARFSYDQGARIRLRQTLGFGDGTLVVGSIGRLSGQKNPLFSVRVLAELVAAGVDARLLLIGDGELVESVASLANELGVAELYVHISSVENAEAYYCALDAFLMPSVFEGFGFSLIEAQCSGLPCIVSEAIQDEAKVSCLVKCVRLSEGPGAWANAVRETVACEINRATFSSILSDAGFSLSSCINVLEELYCHA